MILEYQLVQQVGRHHEHGTQFKLVELQHDCMLDLNYTGNEYKHL